MKEQESIGINEAARLKGVSRQAIHAAIKSGKLECIEVPSITRRVLADSLKAFTPNVNMKRTKPKR